MMCDLGWEFLKVLNMVFLDSPVNVIMAMY